MPLFAAVDIGANSVRLKIARLKHRRLELIHADREVTRLGESVFSTGLLAPRAMAHTVKVLRRFHRAAQARAADRVRVLATSALRDARNAQAFLDWVRAATGWSVEVISGLEEARLIHLGILSNLRMKASPLLLMDLGGGSCELTLSERGHIRQTVSLPLGAVRLTQEFLRHDPPKRREVRSMRRLISQSLARVAARIARSQPRTVVATSGTAAALHSMYRANYGRKDGRALVPRAAVLKFAEKLSRMPLEKRATLRGLGPRRAEIIIAGAAAFAEVLERCQLRGFQYSDLGLRDGALAQMAAEQDRSARTRRQIESDRWDALVAAGHHYHVDLANARQVRELAMQLFERLQEVHRLPPEYKEWLSAAAMLQEVGVYINRAGLHRHAWYIIAHSEILGFAPAQRRVIAAIARYVGKTLPSSRDTALQLLSPSDRKLVPKAVALLRLARAMNQGRGRVISGVRAAVRDSRVLLRLKPRRRTGADLELWMLAKERGFFRQVFGRDLSAALA